MTGPRASRALSRRGFLARAAGLGLGLALGGAADLVGGSRAAAAGLGYGPLLPDPAGRLALPRGFRYRVVAEAGDTELRQGGRSPGRADGAASFALPGGLTALVVNHENAPTLAEYPVPALPGLTYDASGVGGTTTILLGPDGSRLAEYVSLAGTERNCAGGVTPWGTWLSCEESEARRGDGDRQQDHGYVFEVDPADPSANLDPAPVKALGRFRHEAVAVDPARGELYLTEDAEDPDGLLYRWSPPSVGPLGRGALRRLGPDDGVLAALRALDPSGAAVPDLARAVLTGTTYRVEWEPVPDRDAREVSVRNQFAEGAVSRAHKLEGLWWGDGGAYVVSSFARADRAGPDPEGTGAGAAHGGQVWFLDPAAQTLTLVLRYAPRRGPGRPDGPDNVTVSPYGGLILAEDGDGGQHLLGATPYGGTYLLARNEVALAPGVYSEFAGPHFSPDGTVLFASLYQPGTVFAVTGPWRTGL